MANRRSDSTSEDECSHKSGYTPFILYRERADWKDVVPVPQNDGPNPIVAIAYSEKFKDVYDYFRAILQMQEKSGRALELTEDALDLNPANYTVWQYRRQILRHMKSDLGKELEYVKYMISEHPKNYQVWHHRRVIVEWKQDPVLEMSLTAEVLAQDAKNYHAWQHRQWVIQTFNLFEDELRFTEELLRDDVRNNSAWNQRYFVVSRTTGFTPEVLESEVAFSLRHIADTTHNESAWNYLRGVLQHNARGLDSHPGVRDFVEDLYTVGNRSPYLMAFLVEMLAVRVREGNDAQAFARVSQLCESLATEHDVVRAQYWRFLQQQLAPPRNCEPTSFNHNNMADTPV